MSVKSGTLEPLKLFKIFRSLLDRRTNGELTLARGPAVKRVRLLDGKPVRVVSNVPRESIMGALQEQGVLDGPRLQALQKIQAERGVSGERALVEIGLMNAARLKVLEGQLARRRLLETFGWRDGTFTFAEGVAVPGDVEGLINPIDPIELLLEASARVVRQEDCLGFLSAYPGEVVRLTEWNRQYGAFFDRLFGQSNVRLLLARPMTFDDLVREIGDEQRTARQIFGLVIGGLGVFGGAPGKVQPAQPAAPQPAQSPTPPAPAAPRPQVTVNRPSGPMRGVVSTATPPPDGFGRSPTPTPPPRPRPASVQAEVSPATPAPRSAPQAPSRPAPPARNVQRPAEPQARSTPGARMDLPSSAPRTPARKAPAATGEIPERQRKTIAEIEVLAKDLATKSHYELLGIEQKLDTDKIRSRFRQLAREYHVNRFARYGLSEDLMKRIQKVFMGINRAHEVLTDPDQRKEYDLTLEMAQKGHLVHPQSGIDAAGIFKAEQLVRDGTIAVKNNKPDLAKQKFEQALDKSPQEPVARAGLAFVDFMIAQGQGGSVTMAGRTRDTIEAICTPELAREEPFVYLGRVYRILGDPDKAMKAFNRALEINRHCNEASSELRHLQRKAEEAGPKKGGGLFGKKK